MKITFLGTGTSTGIPMIACPCPICASTDLRDKRLRSSVMIQNDGKTIVIDTGPDFRQQMLREKVKEVHGVLLTHSHIDHIGGLDDIRAFNFFMKRDMDVYLSEASEVALRKHNDYIFATDPYPGIPRVQLHRIGAEKFNAHGFEVVPITVMHHQMPVHAFRINNDFTYITDANYIAPEEKEKARGSKILVVNALRWETHISHFTVAQAIELVEELKPEVAYFTHISHQLGLHEEVEKKLPPHIHLAYDGLSLMC